MSGYVDLFFQEVLTYINICWQAEIIKYLLSFLVVFAVLGLLKKLIKINN